MSFTDIDSTYPRGTQQVCDLDDAIRETREWIENSLKEISCYPNISTVRVCGWTEANKPAGVLPGSLGFNSDTKALEYLGEDGKYVSYKDVASLETSLIKKLDKVDVENKAGKVPRFTNDGRLQFPTGYQIWIE